MIVAGTIVAVLIAFVVFWSALIVASRADHAAMEMHEERKRGGVDD